jgi:hypothetical protein
LIRLETAGKRRDTLGSHALSTLAEGFRRDFIGKELSIENFVADSSNGTLGKRHSEDVGSRFDM